MQWILIPVQIILGSLIPALVLWLIGRKKYDLIFWKMLVITFTASLVSLIPIAGFILPLFVYYGLLVKFADLDLGDAIWITFLADVVHLVVVMILVNMFFATAMGIVSHPEDFAAHLPSTMEQDSLPPPSSESKGKSSLKMISADGSALTKKFIKRFNISGTGKGVNGSFAIINDEVYHEGHVFEDGSHIEKVIRAEVIIFADGESHHLLLR